MEESSESHLSDTITCEELDRRQYENDLELLRIELESKKLELDTATTEHLEQMEQLEERAMESERMGKVWELKCRELQQQQPSQAMSSSYKGELREIAQRQKLLEATNRQLAVEAKALTEGLGDLSVTEVEYGRMATKPLSQRSIADAARMKLFESIQPVRSERDKLQRQIDTLSNAYAQEAQTAAAAKGDSEQLRKKCEEQMVELERARGDLNMAQELIARNHDKALKFDDQYKQLEQATLRLAELENTASIATGQLDQTTMKFKELQITHETMKQRESLLEEDKMYLKRQTQELSQRKSELEKINADLMDRNLRLQSAREELVEKYLTGADTAREVAHNENRNNILQVKSETDQELERIKKHLNELYTREADALRNSRDHAETERDTLRAENERLKKGTASISQDLAVIRSQKDADCAAANQRAAHAELEAKRIQLARNELERTVERCQREAQAATRKCEILQREVYQVQNEGEKHVMELESEQRDLRRRVTAYEKIESDLDSLILEEACQDPFAPLSANIPVSSQRRMEQSTRLAKRVLNLEKINADLVRENEQAKRHNDKMHAELKVADDALDKVNQPTAFLVQSQREKASEINRLKETVRVQNKKMIDMEESIDRLRQIKEQLSSDLERLLSNQDILGQIRSSLQKAVKDPLQRQPSRDQPEPINFTK